MLRFIHYYHGSAGANVQKTTQNSNSSWDNTSQQRAGGIWDAANSAANTGPSAASQQAQNTFSGYQTGGKLGFGALTGDSAAASKFMNPYQQNVIDANSKEWDNINARTMQATDDAATRSNAFGGSRHGVAEGEALADNNRAQATQTAGLLQSGFDNSMNRAGQAAQLGFGAAQQNVNAMSPEERRLYLLKQGFLGPQGQQSSGAQTTAGVNGTSNVNVG